MEYLGLLRELYPSLEEPEFITHLMQHSEWVKVQEDDILMEPNHPIRYMPLVLEGALRILRADENGNEMFLYHLKPGETCAMSMNCAIAGGFSQIKAVVELPTLMCMIPLQYVKTWMEEFPVWRDFILSTYHARFHEMLRAFDIMAFKKMDQRLVHYLNSIAVANNSNELSVTHQKIADDLFTTREVVSRLLNILKSRGDIVLKRNMIELKTSFFDNQSI